MVSYASSLAREIAAPVPRGIMRRGERMVYFTLGLAIAATWPADESSARAAYPLWAALGLIATLLLRDRSGIPLGPDHEEEQAQSPIYGVAKA